MEMVLMILTILSRAEMANTAIVESNDGNEISVIFSEKHFGKMQGGMMVIDGCKIFKDCLIFCVQYIKCASVNYHSSLELCELVENNISPSQIDPIEGWVSFGTETSVNMVSNGRFHKSWKKKSKTS